MSNSCCFSVEKENMCSQALVKLLKKPCDTVKLAGRSPNRYLPVYLRLVLLWAIPQSRRRQMTHSAENFFLCLVTKVFIDELRVTLVVRIDSCST